MSKQMATLPLIGLTGKKRVGKDTVANYLTEMGYKTSAFADPLKSACQTLFGLSKEQLYNQTLKEEPDPYWGKTPRFFMQFLGTDLLRHQFDANIWTRLMEKRIGDDPQGWIITDVRFPNEAEFIKQKGGVIVKIVRPDVDESDQHESEHHDIESDYLIENNGSIPDLYQKADGVFQKIITKSGTIGCGE